MKRIVLLGDSIRLGYEPFVRAELAGEAFVWGPPDNGQHSTNLLMNFWPWIAAQQPDILHMNSGIWDTRRVARGSDLNVVPLPIYRENIRNLIRLTRCHTNALIIWATATPLLNEPANETQRKNGMAGRDAADIPLYNEAASEAAREESIPVNDLYSLVIGEGPGKLLLPDGVHYGEQGCRFLGSQVAAFLRTVLDQPSRKL
jgi:lysophospholipase L1-like esterase